MDEEVFNIDKFVFIFNNKPIKITIAKDIPKISAGDRSIGPFKKGDKTAIPLWQAQLLIKQDLATLQDPIDVTLADLHKIQWREQGSSALQKLPEDFFVKARHYLTELSEKNKISPDPISVDDEKRSKAVLRDIIELRTDKMIKLAKLGTMRGVEASLSEEEKWLLSSLIRLLSTWKDQILK